MMSAAVSLGPLAVAAAGAPAVAAGAAAGLPLAAVGAATTAVAAAAAATAQLPAPKAVAEEPAGGCGIAAPAVRDIATDLDLKAALKAGSCTPNSCADTCGSVPSNDAEMPELASNPAKLAPAGKHAPAGPAFGSLPASPTAISEGGLSVVELPGGIKTLRQKVGCELSPSSSAAAAWRAAGHALASAWQAGARGVHKQRSSVHLSLAVAGATPAVCLRFNGVLSSAVHCLPWVQWNLEFADPSLEESFKLFFNTLQTKTGGVALHAC
jgi:hypothetical protein